MDLTLRVRKTGEFLFMGSVFDDPDDVSHTGHFEKLCAGHASEKRFRLATWRRYETGGCSTGSCARRALLIIPMNGGILIGERSSGSLTVKCRRMDSARLTSAWYGPAETPR